MPYYTSPLSKRGRLAHAIAGAISGAPRQRNGLPLFDSSDPRQIRAAKIRRFLAQEPPWSPQVEALRTELTELTKELS